MSGDVRKDTNPKDRAAAVTGRVPLSLFPSTAVVAGSMAMHEGACKYGRYNYRVAGVLASVYKDALDRHSDAWWNGENIDPDSGLPHLWKALACLAILIDAEECGMLTDDRPPKAPVAEMLARLKAQVLEIAERLSEYDPHQYTIADTPGNQPVPNQTVPRVADDVDWNEVVADLNEQAAEHRKRLEASQ